MEKNFRVGLLQCRTRQSILFSLQSYKNGRNQAKVLPHHRQCDTLKAFVYVRFNDWKKTLIAFDHHKKSELHRSALQPIPNQRNQNVLKLSHKRKMEVMKENRVTLEKIFTSLKFLGCQGLAIRGKEEATSNLAMLLQERMEDVAELKQWLI